jgi:hypothetical protein
LAKSKTPRYDDIYPHNNDEYYSDNNIDDNVMIGRGRDSFPTHSSAAQSYLPFENERLAKHVLVRQKSLPTPTTTAPTLSDDWGHKVNSVDDRDDKRSYNSVIKSVGGTNRYDSNGGRNRLDSWEGQKLNSYYNDYSTSLWTTSTTTTTTTTTTTSPPPPRRRITTLSPYLQSYYGTGGGGSDSPFAVVPPEATPRTLSQSVADLTGLRGPSPPDPPPSATPTRRRPSERLNNGFSYEDYFGYGAAPPSPPRERRPSISLSSPTRPKPTPILDTFQPRKIASGPLLMVEEPAVTVRPYGRPRPTPATWSDTITPGRNNRLTASPTVKSEVFSRPPSSSAAVGAFGRKSGIINSGTSNQEGRSRRRKIQALAQQKRLREALADIGGQRPPAAAKPQHGSLYPSAFVDAQLPPRRQRPQQHQVGPSLRQLPTEAELRDQIRALRRAKRKKAAAAAAAAQRSPVKAAAAGGGYPRSFFAEPTFPSFAGFAAGLG